MKGVVGLTTSRVYLTEPQGVRDQPWFANQAARLTLAAGTTPLDLLHGLQAIEQALGRDRREEIRHGPRNIDLDLLLFDTIVFASEELTVPHPRLSERAFVLVPLLELEPGLSAPGVGSLQEALRKLDFSINDGCIRQ